ncbi:MAG: alpha-galactosidase [Bacteroidaceae bacterium]|nr:alpha-galactosidase [Bacteroidaceae bacterium]
MKKIILYAILCCGVFITSCTSEKTVSDDKAFLPPLMGWSSWNTYFVDISEELIKKQADAMVATGLKDAGYQYINIDDGFFGFRDKDGKMTYNAERFPNGMRVVSDYIHSLGLKAGIYSEGGDNTCGSMYNAEKSGVGAGFYGHDQQDADVYFKDWNFDFIKIDYCGGKELGLPERERYESIVKAIRNTGRTDASINICRWAYPGHWAANIARSWRISSDIQPRWRSVKYIIGKNMYLSAYAGNGGYNDMDMLEIGRGMPLNEEEVHFGMWCIMSSPLLIGCDMTSIPDYSLELLKNKELIAINQDVLGLQAYVAQRNGDAYVLVKDIETKRGTKRAVAFYNSSDSACDITVPFKTLELGGKVQVRDLIKHKDIGTFEGEMSHTLPGRSVLICTMQAELRLEPEVYEAEWAFLPCFDDLGHNPRIIRYSQAPDCSGGVKVAYVGAKKENRVVWREVYSEKGGEYEMAVSYCSAKDKKLQISVNGTEYSFEKLNSGDWNKPAVLKLTVNLKPGYNEISMGCDYSWGPDIDKFELRKK